MNALVKESEMPDGWAIRAVREMGDVIAGKALAATAPGKLRPYFRTKNVFDGYIAVDDVLAMPMTDEQFETFRLRPGDVLLNEGQSLDLVGRCAIYAGEYPGPCAIQNALLRFRARPEVSSLFASYVFRKCQQSGVFARVALQTTSVAHLGVSRFANLQLQWPMAPEEQHAIATALSDIDALIAGLERLIAKKRDIKQAAMQQLLTGQTRLPGFSGEWSVRSLGTLGTTYGGLVGKSKVDFGHGSASYVPFVNVMANVRIDCSAFESVDVATTETQNRVLSGDLLFNGSSETPEEVALCALMTRAVDDLYLNSFCFGFRLKQGVEASGLFLTYLMRSQMGRELMKSLAQGSTRYNLSKSALLNAQLKLPGLEEQTAIANVLSDMDADLSTLESRLAKTCAIKQGMMQELLTGRTRLVDSIEQAPVQKAKPAPERKANVYFMRSVLAAEIVDQLHHEPTFGHVKFEKMMFLAEHLCHVDTGSHYARKAAGPLDRKALHSIDKQLRGQKWFDGRKENGRYRYVPLEKRGGHKSYFDRYFAPIRTQLSEILDTFRSWETERCEIVATLYGAWNDLLREKGAASDDMIVHEVLNNWHESKQRIPEERWLKALGWMREKGYVPDPVVGPDAR